MRVSLSYIFFSAKPKEFFFGASIIREKMKKALKRQSPEDIDEESRKKEAQREGIKKKKLTTEEEQVKRQLLETCPTYATQVQAGNRYVWGPVQFMLQLANAIHPANATEVPTEELCERVRKCIRENTFGKQTRVQGYFNLYPGLPVHLVYQKLFDEKATLSTEEAKILQACIRARNMPYQPECFLLIINALRKFRKKSKLPDVSLFDCGRMGVTHAALFTVVQSSTSAWRRTLLEVTGFVGDLKALTAKEKTYTEIQRKLKDMQKTDGAIKKCDRATLLALWERVGCVENKTIRLSAMDVLTEIRTCGVGQMLLQNVFFKVLKAFQNQDSTEQHKLDAIIAQIERERLTTTKITPTLSPWHARVFQDLQPWTEKANTAWKEYYRKKATQYLARFLLDLQTCLEEQKYESRRADHHVVQSFFEEANEENWTAMIRSVSEKRTVKNHLVRTAKPEHHARPYVKFILAFLNGPLRPQMREGVELALEKLLAAIPNKRTNADCQMRRGFNPDEISRMLALKMTVGDEVLLNLLVECAFRNSALCHLQYETLLDVNTHTAKPVIHVQEKNNKTRSCVVSTALSQKIATLGRFWQQKLQNDEQALNKCYVFNLHDHTQPLVKEILQERIARIALGAGVTEVHAHPHAFRCTLVQRLFADGKSFAEISKLLGHTHFDTTFYYYYAPVIEALLTANGMNPFIKGCKKRNKLLWQRIIQLGLSNEAMSAIMLQGISAE